MTGAACYDDVLDITWLADADLAASNTFGVSGIDSFGLMSWDTANDCPALTGIVGLRRAVAPGRCAAALAAACRARGSAPGVGVGDDAQFAGQHLWFVRIGEHGVKMRRRVDQHQP